MMGLFLESADRAFVSLHPSCLVSWNIFEALELFVTNTLDLSAFKIA